MADLNANKVNDMLEALNEAMEIHAQNAIKNLPFNKTELAEVVDITRRDEGWYIVWNGSTRYMAFSENTSYKMGAKVYVNIPNNNFDNQKTIIGQHVSENEQSIFFRSPLAGYQPMTDNILAMNGDDIPNEFGLIANWSGVDLEAGQQIIKIFGSDKLIENPGYSGYKYIAISANVKTLLGATTIGGNYGIKVMLEGVKKQDTIADVEMETRTYYLDTKNMIGSVYNFDTYYKQEALFDISDFDQLSSILVAVYQDGTFKDNENNAIPHTYKISEDADEQLVSPNIFLKDIEITFGDDAQNGRDILKLKTLQGKTYNSSQKDSLNEKNLSIEWIHLNPETEEREKITNRSEAVKMSDISNYIIHWYRDSLQSTSDYTYIIENLNAELDADNKLLAYKKWQKAENPGVDDPVLTEAEKQTARNTLITTFNLTAGRDYTVTDGYYSLSLDGERKINGAISGSKSRTTPTTDNLAGPFWREMTSGIAAWDYTRFLPDLKRQYTKVKVIIEYWSGDETTPNPNNEGYTIVQSNEIQFNNLADIPMEDKNSGLKIEFTDKTDGNYPIYNSITGQLLSRLEETKDRQLRAVFNDSNGNSYFNGNEVLIWKIPISNSMILLNESFYSDIEKLTEEDFNSFITSVDFNNIKSQYNEAELAYEKSDKGEEALRIFNTAKSIYYSKKALWEKQFKKWGQFADLIYDNIVFEPGYIYIKREAVNNVGGPVNSYQSYRIAPYYNKGRTTNTVWCYVIKNNEIYHTAATMTFNQHGTCGTDYTFTLGLGPKIIDETPPKEQGQTDDPPQVWTVVGPSDTALTVGDIYTDSENNEVPAYHEILFDLYNSKNERIDLTPEQKNVIINAWTESGQRDKGYYAGKNNASNLEFIKGRDDNDGRVIVRAPSQKKIGDNITNLSVEDFEYIVLQAFVTSEVQDDNNNPTDDLGSIEFYQYYPLHIREAGSDWELNGSDYIVYDDKGANPTCYNDKFELVSKTPNVEKITDGFKIIYNDIPGLGEPSPETYYPHIDKTGKLQPTPLFIGSISKDVALVGLQGTGDNLRIVYTCPIVIIENKYEIPAINKWNGQMVLDKDGNKILASMVGAGHKNPEGNTFSGVLMGDVEYKDERTGGVKPATGLFGYDNSEQTFGFNTNGEAFIGKSDVGRIYIDGNTGRITSAAREAYDINHYHFINGIRDAEGNLIRNTDDLDPRGTEINLKENYIDIQGESSSLNEDTNKSRIHLDTKIRPESEGGTEAYFSIHSNKGKKLIHIADNNYYLQTENYVKENPSANPPIKGSGLKIDLQNGTFDSQGTLTINGDSNSSIQFGSAANGYRFKVDGSNGKVTLSSLDFVDDNGEILTSRGGKNQLLTANNIKPQWKTFVTDISGKVHKSPVKIEISIKDEVEVDYYVNEPYSYPVTTTQWVEGVTKTLHTLDQWNYSTTGFSIISGPAQPYGPEGGDSSYVTTATMDGYAKVTGTETENRRIQHWTKVPYTYEGTGSSTYDFVDGINLTVKKISMWALTNDSEEPSTVNIF